MVEGSSITRFARKQFKSGGRRGSGVTGKIFWSVDTPCKQSSCGEACIVSLVHRWISSGEHRQDDAPPLWNFKARGESLRFGNISPAHCTGRGMVTPPTGRCAAHAAWCRLSSGRVHHSVMVWAASLGFWTTERPDGVLLVEIRLYPGSTDR